MNPLINLDLIRELIGTDYDLMDQNFEDLIWIFSNLCPRSVLFIFGLALRRVFLPPPSARRNYVNRLLGTKSL